MIENENIKELHEHNHEHEEECCCGHHHEEHEHEEECCCGHHHEEHEHEEECCCGHHHEEHEHEEECCCGHHHEEHEHNHNVCEIPTTPTKQLAELENGAIRIVYEVENLDCANCALKVEEAVAALPFVKQANLRFDLGRLTVDVTDESKLPILEETVLKKEKDVILRKVGNDKFKKTYRIENLDCANCALKVEQALNRIPNTNAIVRFDLGKIMVASAYEISDERIIQVVKQNESDAVVTLLDELHEEEETQEESDSWKWVLLACFVAFIVASVVLTEGTLQSVVLGIIYVVLGKDVILKAIRNIKRGDIFDENFLMGVATVGAIAIGEYSEAVAVMLFYQIGEYFQSVAVNNSRKSIKSLMKIRPDSANLVVGDTLQVVHPATLSINDIVAVHPGERIPVDGVLIKGQSSIDLSALTGESLPVNVEEGATLLSGGININGEIQMRVVREFGESTASKILKLVEEAGNTKADTEKLITKFAKIYTPVVCLLAVLLAVFPPLLGMGEWTMWLERALTFLVISCPCAVVISIPLSYFGGIGAASKQGILIKGSQYLEEILHVDLLAMDKTGTLTEGKFSVSEVVSEKVAKEELIYIAAIAEQYSTHPIGKAIVNANQKEFKNEDLEHLEEIAGNGIKATIFGENYLVGNERLMQSEMVKVPSSDTYGSIVYIAKNQDYLGYIVVSDSPKKNTPSTIQTLHSVYHKEIVMLSGDNQKAVNRLANELHLDSAYGALLPQDKLEVVRNFQTKENRKVAFVGDGMNDAPVLTLANVGIAMGGIGSDAAIEASDIVLMEDDISKLKTLFDIASFTKRIVTQNLVFVFLIKVITLLLGAFGYASMWMAVFADVGVSIIAILNSLRILKRKY